MLNLITFEESEDAFEEEPIDFKNPEDVIIHVYPCTSGKGAWEGWGLEVLGIDRVGDSGVMGAASWEHDFNGFLDNTVASLIDCPKREGVFVVETVTGEYNRGDGYTTDGDMEFYCENVRSAAPNEIAIWF